MHFSIDGMNFSPIFLFPGMEIVEYRHNIVALIDPMISEPCFEMEILRCIHVGLLCVQDFAKNRPNVSIVISDSPCLKVRLLIFIIQSYLHLLKGRLP